MPESQKVGCSHSYRLLPGLWSCVIYYWLIDVRSTAADPMEKANGAPHGCSEAQRAEEVYGEMALHDGIGVWAGCFAHPLMRDERAAPTFCRGHCGPSWLSKISKVLEIFEKFENFVSFENFKKVIVRFFLNLWRFSKFTKNRTF